MVDAATFLAELNAERQRAQAKALAEYLPPPLLDPALEVALKHGFFISPINGHSERSLYWDRIGSPCRDKGQIELLVDTWMNLNWALETSASGVIALEIELDLARDTLVELTGDEWHWLRTLRF